MVVAGYVRDPTQHQNSQRDSPLRTERLLQLLILCTVAGLVFTDASAAASDAHRSAICRPAVMTAARSTAIAAVTRAHTDGAGVAVNFRRCVSRRGSCLSGKPACLGDQQRLHMHKRVSQRSRCSLQWAFLPAAGEEHRSVERFCCPTVIKRSTENIAVPAGAHTAVAAPAARARREYHTCSSCVLPFSSERPRTGPSAQERHFMGSKAVDIKWPQKVVHLHAYRRQQLPYTEVKSQRCITCKPPLSWLLLMQRPCAAEANHAMSQQQPRICGYAYYPRTPVKTMHDSATSFSHRRRIRSGRLIDSSRGAEYSNTCDSDRKRITRERGENASACFACVGTDHWNVCSRTSTADTVYSDTCNISNRSEYNFVTIMNNIARENSWGGFSGAGTLRGSGRRPRYIRLVQQLGVESERLAFFPSRLHAKRPRARAEKRAKNYQRAYEEQRRREQQQLHRQQQQQRELLEQQEETERQRAEQRRLSERQEDADERGSAAGGTATLTQLMEEARVASGEVIKHRENFVVVGSTQRRVHGRRPPNKQRYENQQEFVTFVFKELPVAEEELQAEILKAERAWRGDMMLDELEAEIGGPDALAPAGVGALAR